MTKFLNILKIDLKLNERIFGLDLLRAFAILIVVYQHGGFFLKSHTKYYELYKIPIVIDGVTVFFVLSGFLIGTIILRSFTKTIISLKSLYNFWIKRWVRTLPNYYLVLTILYSCYLLFIINIKGFSFSYFFFLQNFFQTPPDFFFESWSLAVEEWFYLLFPICLFLINFMFKNLKKSFLTALLLFIFISFFFKLTQYFIFLNKDFHFTVFYRFDSIGIGILAAYISFYYTKFWNNNKAIMIIISVVLFAFHIFFQKILMNNIFYSEVITFIIESLIVFLALPYLCSFNPKTNTYLIKFVTFISIISYSLYLLHYSVMLGIAMPLILTEKFHSNNMIYYSLIKYIIYWFLSIGLASFLYAIYEKPIMNLRNKLLIK